MTNRITRRSMLRGAAAGGALAPFVPLFQPRASAATFPKRLLVMYTSNGTVPEAWTPKMDGANLVLSPILAPLEALKQHILVIGGLQNVRDSGHFGGINGILTGTAGSGQWPLANGISADQLVANTIGKGNRFLSIEAGVEVAIFSGRNPTESAIAYRGPAQPILPENDPGKVFDRLFAGFKAPAPMGAPAPQIDPAAEQARLHGKSVIDQVRGDLSRFRARVGAADIVKIDAHLEALRELEKGLAAMPAAAAPGATCVSPAKAAPGRDLRLVMKAQMDSVVAAMACDLTRVGSVMIGRSGAQHRFPWLGSDFTSDHHDYAHDEANATSRAKLVKINAWYAEQFAYLLGKLKAIPEGNGSMLDNMVVMWVNELATGSHSHKGMPFVVAGGASGYFKTGRFVAVRPGTRHNDLLVSVINAMGLEEVTTFGDRSLCTGALPGFRG